MAGSAASAQRLDRREQVWELRCQGYTQTEIAEQLGVSQSTICRDLQWWAGQVIERIAEQGVTMKVEQVGQLEHIVSEAMGSWRKSKEPDKTVSKTQSTRDSDAEGKLTTEQVRTQVREQAGDPRYLQVALKAMEDIRKVVGLDAPIRQQLELTGRSDAPIRVQGADLEALLDGMGEDELRLLVRAIDKLEAAAERDGEG